MAIGTVRAAKSAPQSVFTYYLGLGLILLTAAAVADPRVAATWIADALLPAAELLGSSPPAQPEQLEVPSASQPAPVPKPRQSGVAQVLVASAAAPGSNGSWPKSSWPQTVGTNGRGDFHTFGTNAVSSVQAVFQQGVFPSASYASAVDTFIHATDATVQATAQTLTVDLSPGPQAALIKFGGLFTSEGGPIPIGSTINSAILQVSVPTTPSNAVSSATISFYALKHAWADTNTYATFGTSPWNLTAGIQVGNTAETEATADAARTFPATGFQTVDVTSRVQIWASDPASNFGWVVDEGTALDDGFIFESAEAPTGANRPKLTVTYTPPGACLNNSDCPDGNPCTDDICDLGTGICSHPNNDANACDDLDLCTTGDFCSSGDCTGTPVSCSGGQVCNPANGQCESGEVLVRQPYLQQATPTSMTIVWRSGTAGDSRVRYGTTQGNLNQTATNATVDTNHIVTITGLQPATRYYYDVGTTATVQGGGTANHFFKTSPPANDTTPFRVWALGDSGEGNATQLAVRDAMLTYTAANPPDLMIHMGDIAYSSGTDAEFTNKHFAVYQDTMRNTPFWPTLGNHEGASTTSGSPGASTGPYYTAFVLPTNAEAGGVASGTEAYYSFDRGNTHFVVLNSFQVSRAAAGPMAVWLQADLAATNKQWVIAFWHHPPYSKGTHNSDAETELIDMRQNLLPILEAGGVDLVMTGHSHNYERSYLIDGTYTTPTPGLSTLQSQGHIIDSGSGKLAGSGPYHKNNGMTPHEGAVFVVAGHGGATPDAGNGALNHPVMYFSEADRGSCILDISETALTLTNVRSTGVVSDDFTIQKGAFSSPTSTSFQQGVNGYTGTQDTVVHQNFADTVEGSAVSWKWDTEDPVGFAAFGLIRFDNIFGSGAGQIPVGSTVTSATLTLVGFNATVTPAGTINEVAVDWQQSTATWNNFGGDAGVQSDEYRASPSYTAPLFTGALTTNLITAGIDVTASLQSWSTNPALNFGWVFRPNTTDGAEVYSAEQSPVDQRPLLTVTYTPPATSCIVDADCNDNNPCNGIETCVATVCQAGTALSCDDGLVCTTDTCNTGTGCVHTNNTASCSDGDACTTGDACSGGVCVSGAATNCDDGNVCTTDSCNTSTGCVHTPMSCPSGQSCNPANGQCQAAQSLPIAIGDSWKYFKGTVEPPAAWAGVAFDDSSWLSGPSGFGYGDGDDATVLSDMQSTTQPPGYVAVYIRKAFSVSNPASVVGLDLIIDYDDGFVAYLNGTEVARRNMTAVAYNSVATASHEASAGASGNPPETISLNAYLGLLVSGTNVLAIHGANQDVNSSDLSLIPRLTATLGCATNADCADGNLCTSDVCNTGSGICSFSAVTCSAGYTCNPSNGVCEAAPAPPNQPTNPSPANGATGVSTSPQVCAVVSDPNGDNLNVTFKGRLSGQSSGQPFTIVAMPDTQFYACGIDCPSNFPAGQSANGPVIFNSQTQWIVDNKASRNIAFVTQLGDCVNDGNAIPREWPNSNAAFSLLENPVTTGLPSGIPYGIAPGNHDQTGNGIPRVGTDEGEAFNGAAGTFTGTTQYYNQTFGRFRFAGRSYFGNNYDFGNPSLYTDSMDNHYELFSASGMNFIIFHLEYDTTCSWPSSGSPTPPLDSCQGVLSWMRNVLVTYSNRRAIITTHWIATPGSTSAFSTQGQAIFNAIKDLPNVFMMLGGHLDQSGEREDLATDGHKIFTLPTDFQTRPQGGGGWLRIMTFDPASNSIHIETYSPFYGRFINKPLPRHADDQPNQSPSTTDPTAACYWTGSTGHSTNGSCNELILSYAMDSGGPYGTFGSVTGVHSGDTVCVPWTVETLNPGAAHQWYVEVSDGQSTTTGPTWSFTTGTCTTNADCDDANVCTTDVCSGGACQHNAVAGCCNVNTDCDDGNPCNGGETCSSHSCQPGTAPNCADANPCTTDSCVNPTGCVHNYAPTPGCCSTSADCNDGVANTVDTCSGGSCQNVLNPTCTTAADCNDGDTCTTDTCVGGNVSALSFDGVDDYVTMGQALGLNAETFTVEFWFRWTGATPGTTILTGTGGVTLVPLVAKGAPEADASVVDANYIIGLRDAGGGNWTLAADMEEHTTGTTPGLNHPILGTVVIPADTWHHAAVTYDRAGAGTGTWRLFVDGNLDTALAVGQPPNYACTQHFALGTLLTSTGAVANNSGIGQFHGYLDEVRVWSRPLQQIDIQAGMNQEILSGTGLLGRWGLNENSGTTANDSATGPAAENGTLTNGPTWSATVKPDLGTGTCQHGAVAGCCNTNAQCDDANSCTTDTCNLGSHTCQHVPLGECCVDADCNDANPCTNDTCDTGTHACAHTNNTASCDDNNACTTGDVCLNGTCAGTQINCSDGNACTTDSCSGGTCGHVYAPTPGCCATSPDCNDGNAGTTDACSGGNCSNIASTCTASSECNDGDVCTADTCVGGNLYALRLNGSTQWVTMGAAPGLNAQDFTLEAWIKWNGSVTPTASSGGNGKVGVPIIVKGVGEGDGSNVDADYFFAIDSAGKLVADFESFEAAVGGNNNYPVQGTTPVTANVWHHVAVTYDAPPGTGCWQLYLDGVADTAGTTCPNMTPRYDNIQYFGIGVGQTSNGTTSGAFGGRIDEVRVWNVARTPAQIQATMSQALTSGTGLIGRWGFEDGSTATDSTSPSENGTLVASPVFDSADKAPLSTGNCQHTAVPNCCTTAAQCDDGNVCTTDACVGNSCTHTPTNEGGSCNDGNACTTSDACSAGVCGGTAVVCTASDQCHSAGTCDSQTGLCSNPAKANGSACNDGLACTTSDVCTAGVCGGTAVVCTASDQCHVAGTCDTQTGLCSNPAKADGTACDDGNACTQTDTCQSGTCSGANPVVCTASDQCHDVGTCSTSTGLCSNPAKTNGTACNDGLACTTSDVCTAGTCGGTAVVCTALDQCHVAGLCNPGTGVCSNPAKADGTACDDANICTSADACSSGSCVGSPIANCCTTAAQCDDTNACTTDSCSTSNAAAVDLDGANDYIDLGNDGNTANVNYLTNFGTSSFTVEGWFWADTAATDTASLFRMGSQGSFPQVVVQIRTGSPQKLAASVETSVSPSQVDTVTQPTFSLGAWHHFAMVVLRDVVTPANQRMNLYLDGVLAESTVATTWGTNAINDSISSTTRDSVLLGAARTAPGAAPTLFLDGRLDEIRIWNTARTATEISSNMNQQIVSATGLMHRWAMNEGTGTTVADSVGTNNGTLTNGPTWRTLASDIPSIGSNQCAHTPVTNGTTCSDGNACTTGDACTSGVCTGTAINCDDGNSCTTDSCSGGTCSHVTLADGTSCNDGSACTTGDTCAGGTCVGTTLDCNDSNSCTDDSCNPATGCVHANNTASCASDGNPCTDDVCSAGSCAHVNNNANACSDGIACTGDACVNGTCQSWYAPTAGCCSSNADCNDGVSATTDTCVGAPTGTCSNVVPGSCTTAAQCNDSNTCTTDACVGAVGGSALNFDGVDDNITMGTALGLDSATFTLEGWIKKDGASWGVANATTGTGGFSNVVALITKGRSEGDGSNVDCNYFLGITAGGRLIADFEQNAASTSPTAPAGQNRPICSTAATAITDSNWHHVAVSYDKAAGKGWRLYKDGAEVTAANGTTATCGAESTCTDATICAQNPAVDPRFDSIQHFGLGIALNSAGAIQGSEGYFGGEMDEVRVWNRALPQSEIQANMNLEVTSGTGLLGRWGLNENAGTTVNDSATSPTTENGTLRNAGTTATAGNGPLWTSDSPIPSVPGTCTNASIPSCSPCSSDYQCSDSNQCTADSCNTTNDAAVSFPSRGTNTDHVDFAFGSGSNANPDYINWFGTSSFTIEGWVYTDGTSASNASVFRAGESGDASLVGLQITGLSLAASVESSQVNASQTDQYDAPAQTLVANTWTHFALVVARDLVTPANQQLRLYVNGGTPTIAPTPALNWSNSPIGSADQTVLGVARASGGALQLPFVGRVDELRIWNFARTQAQIQSTMNTELESATGLVHRWSFNAGTGTTAVDSIGGISGTFVGVTTWATTPLPFAGTDTCVHASLANGSACSDGNSCTVSDTCQSGSCTSGGNASAGTPCGSSSSTACDNPDTCNASGVCQTNNVTNGTSCSDGNACTTGDSCQSGSCQSGAAVTCNAPPVCHTAVGATCDTGTGACTYPLASDGSACSDGNACTTGDSCQSGSCVSGTPVTCTNGDQCNDAGTCNPGTGTCSAATPKANGTGCDDSNACTQTDTCVAGSCVGSNPVVCTNGDQCNNAGTCNPGTGACSAATPKANGTACDDSDACTQTDNCVAGSCVGSNPVVCTNGDQCNNAGTCNPGTGTCSAATPKADGTACDDGNACTQTDSCVAGSCVGSNPVVCTNGDQCNNAGTCNPGTGTCSAATPKANGTACNDGNPNTVGDVCVDGVCGGTDLCYGITCSALDQCHVAGVCNPLTGVCSNPAAGNGTTCNDGNHCTQTDTCQAGACVGSNPVVCANGDQCNNSGSCNPGTGACSAATPKADGTACADGDACTTPDTCVSGSCSPGPAANCNDGSICTIDSCNSGSGCIHTPINCSDGDGCTLDTCSDPGGCQHTATCGDASSETAPPGGTSSTDPENDGATPNDQIETAVTTPSGGQITIQEGPATQPLPSGYDVVDLQAVITAPPATVESPLVIVFRIDATGLPDGYVLSYLTVFRNGVAVAECSGPAGEASPDPCVSSRVVLGDGDAQITVLTSHASTWNAAFPNCDDGVVCTDDTGSYPSCVHVNNTVGCDDHDACTTIDACQNGSCVGTTPVICNDGNPCTDDACNPLNGACVFQANNGNACTDGNTCTTDTCSGGACLHGASGTCGIGGTVYYYRNSASGSEPSAKPVPSVGIDGTQDAIADSTTDGTGAYALGSQFGNVAVTTLAKYGSPRASDHNGAISSLDASTVARAAVSLITVSPNQFIAGDVTGNGTLSALDASQIARFAVGAVNHFDAAIASGSDWKFLRCNAYAFPGDPGCGAPVYDFTPIAQGETGKNFYAVLLGDVTGNWQPSTGFAASAMTMAGTVESSLEEQAAIAADRQLAAKLAQQAPAPIVRPATSLPAQLSLNGMATPLRAGERRELSIDLRNADGILGLDLGLTYDPSRIRIVGVETAGIGAGFSLARSDLRGVEKIAVFGIVPLSGSGTVLTVTVEALKNTGNQAPVRLGGSANEGGIPLRIRQQRIQAPATGR